MARDFEDHCWRDVIDAETLQIYQAYHRRIYVGDNPAVLAIDLYNKAYLGGNRPVREVDREFSGSCGEHAWKAIPATQRLIAAARRAGVPVIYSTRHVDTGGVQSTNRNMKQLPDDIYDIKAEVAPEAGELVGRLASRGPEVAAVSIIMSMLPASRSCEAGPALRYCTGCNFAPMVFWKKMLETWPGLPMPALPTVAPGLALSQSISSRRLFGGNVLRPTIINGWVEISPTGSRSFSRSIGRS